MIFINNYNAYFIHEKKSRKIEVVDVHPILFLILDNNDRIFNLKKNGESLF